MSSLRLGPLGAAGLLQPAGFDRSVVVARHGGQQDSPQGHFLWSALRWVLSHGVVFLIVAFLAYGYGIRDQLFPTARPESPPGSVSVGEQPADDRVSIEQGPRPTTAAGPSRRLAISEQTIARIDPNPAASPSSPVPTSPETLLDATQQGSGAASGDSFADRTQDAEASAGLSSTTAGQATEPTAVGSAGSLWNDLEGPAGNAGEARAPQVIAGAAQTGHLLEQARRAFWSRDLVLAERRYLDALASAGSVPEVHGELGNLYIQQGRFDRAVEAYYEAGMGFIKRGQLHQAWAVVGLLRNMNSVRAQRLAQALHGAVARP